MRVREEDTCNRYVLKHGIDYNEDFKNALVYVHVIMHSDVKDATIWRYSGQAKLSGVCTASAYAINEDHFDARVGTVAAHELGHKLAFILLTQE